MKTLTTLVAAGLLTAFGACSAERSQAPNGATPNDATPNGATPNGNRTPAAGLVRVTLELPGMD